MTDFEVVKKMIEGSGNVEIKGSKLTALSHLEVT